MLNAVSPLSSMASLLLPRTLRMINLSSVMLSGCTQYLVVCRTKFCWLPPAALSPRTGLPLVRTRSYSFDSLTTNRS